MKLGILLSGGKDSLLAAAIASKYHELTCAITIFSLNDESYMFHVPNIHVTSLQTNAMNIPHITMETKGKKEDELKDLEEAIREAKKNHGIQGVVTGAVCSQYQATRVQKICNKLDLFVFNPLWQMNQIELLETILKNNFKVIIAGVFAYPFDESWLGREINSKTITELEALMHKYKINPSGEGGEIETIVLDCPLFEKQIIIEESSNSHDNFAGVFQILNARLDEKIHDNTYHIRKVKNNPKPEVTIISTVHDPLHQFEFIRPITDILDEEEVTYNISHINKPQLLGEKIIFTGTAIKDNKFLEHKEVARQIMSSNKPILGICAGMELLVQDELVEVKEVGSIFMESKEFPEYNYFLHQYGITEVDNNWEVIASTDKGIAAIRHKTKPILAMQFHPEVTAKNVIRKFIHE